MAFLSRLSGSREAAEDLAQETFLRVFRSRGTYRPSGSFTTWLYTIAYRLHIDARRAWSSSRTDELGEIADNTTHTPEAAAIDSDLNCRVQHEIDALPEQYRPVLSLRSRREMSYAEIGAVVGCSEGAARVRMHKGLALLRRRLKAAGLVGQQNKE